MAHFLHRLGEWAFTHKWQVIAGWLAILAILIVLAVQFIKPTTESITIPGTEAQQALDRFGELFPEAGKGTGRIVFAAPTGKTIDQYQSAIDTAVNSTSVVEGVSAAISPFVNTAAISDDKTIAYALIQLESGGGSVSSETIDTISSIVGEARMSGLGVEMGGDIISQTPGEILGVGEIAGVAVALLVLVMTLGSLVAAGLPILIALVTIGVSMAGLFAMSELFEISATTPVLAVMLGLAVGIDYSLFIVSKYKSYLLEGYKYREAAAKSIGTAGNAVVFAAATVVIALSALTIVQIPFMTTMGLAGAATVALAALVAITLLPALLGVIGSRLFGGKTQKLITSAQKRGARHTTSTSHSSFWYKWGAAITKRPIIILTVAVLVVGAVALPARDLTLGLPTDEFAAAESTERKAYDLLSKGFGAGFNGPLLVVVEGLPQTSDIERAQIRAGLLQQLTQNNTQPSVALSPEEQAKATRTLETQLQQFENLYQLSKVAQEIATTPGVAQAQPALATEDGTKGVIQVTPSASPSDPQTISLITNLRNTDNWNMLAQSDDVTFAVTGSTALQSDINTKLSNALPLYLGVVVGLSLILLIVAFRSILIPIKATLGFLLSVLAMFGALVAVFQWGWFGLADAPGPIVSFIPIIAIGILFGLAMDYEFFLVSSMHEAYSRTGNAKRAVVDGFGLGSKVVTAAGIIMVAVFAGFIFNHDATVQAIGFGLAVGILIDAFVVRMTIVPAVMTLLGKSAWWIPKWLDKILPHVSIEGEEETVRTLSRKK